MQCPHCKAGSLSPKRLEHGLIGYACAGCAGQLMSLGPYVDWAQAQGASERPEGDFETEVRDSAGALLCPKCSRLMLRYKATSDSKHGLDYCFGCEEVWLDGGEWSWLKSKGLHTKIAAISTDPWQRKLKDEHGSRVRLEKFRQTIGDAAFPEVERFKSWLDAQPRRAEILRYLTLPE